MPSATQTNNKLAGLNDSRVLNRHRIGDRVHGADFQWVCNVENAGAGIETRIEMDSVSL